MDEFAHLDAFFNFLRSKEVWAAIIEDVNSIRLESDDGGWLNGKSFSEATYTERISFDLHRTFAYGHAATIFQKRILKRFTFPPVTAPEMADLAKQHLSGAVTETEYQAAKERIIAHLAAITFYSNDDINLGSTIKISGSSLARENSVKELAGNCATIWRSQHGFRVALEPCESYGDLTASAWGKFTDEAMATVSAHLARVLPSVSTTLHLVHSDPNTADQFGFVPYDVNDSDVAADLALLEKGFFSTLLTYYFTPQAKKSSSFEQRMRNAVHLLVEADSQSNRAIGLSLCFSAIEAMLCDKTEGIVDELSRHVAALLEPAAMKRPSVIRAVKQLYNLRSKALHGDMLNEDESAQAKSRLLAAAVLKAAVEWHSHVTRMGEQPNRPDFLSELRTIATTGQRMVGIPDELSVYLPVATDEI